MMYAKCLYGGVHAFAGWQPCKGTSGTIMLTQQIVNLAYTLCAPTLIIPFRIAVNPDQDPQLIMGIDRVGALGAMSKFPRTRGVLPPGN